MKKRNFTLVELLTVIAIIGVISGLIMAALSGGREQARRTEAMLGAESLRSAISQYESDYGQLPSEVSEVSMPIGGSLENQAPDSDYEEMIEKLAGENPRRITYLSVDSEERYLDPWGQEYMVVLDTDYDGEITFNVDGESFTLNRSAAVWSLGNPDRSDRGPILPWD